MPTKAKPKPFATEVELCSAFIAGIGDDWTPYNEPAGWDILLVRKSDGFQSGVQAKLRLNAEVISQCLESRYGAMYAGPDCRAILVPSGEVGHCRSIAEFIGLTVIELRKYEGRLNVKHDFYPKLPGTKNVIESSYGDWFEMAPSERAKLPEYVPDVVAGSSAPVQLTDWKIKAIKIAITVENRGYVTRADFKHLRLDHRRWVTHGLGWLRSENGRYLKGDNFPPLKQQHPKNWVEIEADASAWMLPEHIASPKPAQQPLAI